MSTKIIYHQDGKITYSDGRPVKHVSVGAPDGAVIESLTTKSDFIARLLDDDQSLHDGDLDFKLGTARREVREPGEELLEELLTVRVCAKSPVALVPPLCHLTGHGCGFIEDDGVHESSPSTGGGDAATSPAGEASVGEATVERGRTSSPCCCSCGAACSAGAGVTPVERARRTDGLTARDALEYLRDYHNRKCLNDDLQVTDAEADYGDDLIDSLARYICHREEGVL